MSRRIILVFCFVFLTFSSAIAQDYTKHTVVKGETVTQIAAKYKVTPHDIYSLNPDSQTGITENDVLLIPGASVGAVVTRPKPAQQNSAGGKSHVAKPRETLYSIARDYNVNVDDLKNMNADIVKSGLKIGQTINIPPSAGAGVKAEPASANIARPADAKPQPKIASLKGENDVYHIVEAKETKFGIAKKYGMSVAELERRNPAIASNLPVGYKLTISGKTADQLKTENTVEKPTPVVHEMAQQESVQTEIVKTTKFSGFANYEVKPKETLFSLAQMFDISQDELMSLNPNLKDGVKVGMILKVPGKGSITLQQSAAKSGLKDLSKTISKSDKKRLVLLLPFNASKIQGDTARSISSRLKKDAFLNMTLDFYSGALMAIDSAKVLGMNLDVSIFDSGETKSASNVTNIIQANNFEKADAVIGPFYQQHVEKAAELLEKMNVPLISPLSKENGKSFTNLYQAMPSNECMKSTMLDFLQTKGGNIIVVADPKRMAGKEFISKNYPDVKFAAMTEAGAIDLENMKSLFSKDKMNYVVLDTEKTGMILSSTTVLMQEMTNYQIQLVILEPNDTLDYEEVSMNRLTVLKLIYPSMTRDNQSPESQIFENEYKKRNKVFPNQYAVRGFDVTFDAMLRLAQAKSFEDSAKSEKTEGVEGRFEYLKKPGSEGYQNKGVYILEYSDDLSVKQLN